MSSKKLIVSGLLLVGVLALISSTQSWVTIELAPGIAAQGELAVSGQQLSPPLAPLALALAALAVALTIAGRVFRLVLGVLAALLGIGVAASAIGVIQAPLAAAVAKVTELTGIGGIEATGPGVIAASHLAVWAPITVAAGVFGALLGLAVLVWGRGWAAAGRKYETVHENAAADQAAENSAAVVTHDRISDWDALSDGADPSDAELEDDSAADSAAETDINPDRDENNAAR